MGRDAARQRANVAALLRFESSISAMYGEYTYEPPHGVRDWVEVDDGRLRLIMGRGQTSLGFQVVDSPPFHLAALVPLFGEHCGTSVTSVIVCDPRFADADLPLILAFPDLRELDLSDTAITDVGLVRLAALQRLTALRVSGPNVSSEGLRHLSRCRELRELKIFRTNADEDCVTFLRQSLPQCVVLW